LKKSKKKKNGKLNKSGRVLKISCRVSLKATSGKELGEKKARTIKSGARKSRRKDFCELGLPNPQRLRGEGKN